MVALRSYRVDDGYARASSRNTPSRAHIVDGRSAVMKTKGRTLQSMVVVDVMSEMDNRRARALHSHRRGSSDRGVLTALKALYPGHLLNCRVCWTSLFGLPPTLLAYLWQNIFTCTSRSTASLSYHIMLLLTAATLLPVLHCP